MLHSYTVSPERHAHWLTNVRRSLLLAAILVSSSLFIGIIGYHILGKLNWVDSLLEASMILGGMGPVAPLASDGVKVFASFYALYSGLMLITTTGLLLGPWLHKITYHSHRQAQCDHLDEQKTQAK